MNLLKMVGISMVRLFFLISAFLFSSSSFATPVLGVVISFDCPYCKELFNSRAFLKQACQVTSKKPKCDVRFLPFVGGSNDMRASFFYAARDFDQHEKFAEVVYDLSITEDYRVADLVSVMDSYTNKIDWADEITSERLYKSKNSIVKLSKLIVKHGISDYPSFLWFENKESTLIPAGIDPAIRIKEIIDWIREHE